MEPLAHFEGRIQPLSNVRISPLDRGFLFGDSVYEVLHVYHGRPFLLEQHLQRLERSLATIRIEGVDVPRIGRRILETLQACGLQDATVYVHVTRGAAPRSHAFPSNCQPLELLWVERFTDPYRELRRMGVKVITQPDIRWGHCDVKSTNLLANVLVAQAAKESGAVEAILHRPDGTITEGSRTNVMGMLDGILRTTPNSSAILPGVTRDFVLGLARRLEIPIQEKSLRLQDLPRVSELFLTGTTSEVLPIVQVDSQPIGAGTPGPIALRLHEAFRQAVQDV